MLYPRPPSLQQLLQLEPGEEAASRPCPSAASSCDPSRCETLGPQPNVLSPSCPVEVFPLLSGSERLLSPMDTFFFLQPQDPKVVGTTPGSPGLQLSAHQRPPQTTLRGTRGKGVWDHVHHRGFARISEARLGVRSQRLQMDKKCFIFQALTRLSQLHAHIRSPGDTVPSRSMGLKQSKTMPLGFISAPGYSQWVLGRRKPRALFLLNACPSLADERIIRFLETSGPHRALHIAKALGMKTAKEVNPHLYAMRNRHLLSYDGNTWMIYDSSRRGQELGMRGQSQFGEVRGQGGWPRVKLGSSKFRSGRSKIRIGPSRVRLKKLRVKIEWPRVRFCFILFLDLCILCVISVCL